MVTVGVKSLRMMKYVDYVGKLCQSRGIAAKVSLF